MQLTSMQPHFYLHSYKLSDCPNSFIKRQSHVNLPVDHLWTLLQTKKKKKYVRKRMARDKSLFLILFELCTDMFPGRLHQKSKVHIRKEVVA